MPPVLGQLFSWVPRCIRQHVWWLITLWLGVSGACQWLWLHEAQEHLRMSGLESGGCVSVVVGVPTPICLPETMNRRAASISCQPPTKTLTFRVSADPAWTKSVHSYYMTHNTLNDCEQWKAMSWGCTSVTITTRHRNMSVGELSWRTTTCWVWE